MRLLLVHLQEDHSLFSSFWQIAEQYVEPVALAQIRRCFASVETGDPAAVRGLLKHLLTDRGSRTRVSLTREIDSFKRNPRLAVHLRAAGCRPHSIHRVRGQEEGVRIIDSAANFLGVSYRVMWRSDKPLVFNFRRLDPGHYPSEIQVRVIVVDGALPPTVSQVELVVIGRLRRRLNGGLTERHEEFGPYLIRYSGDSPPITP